MKRLLLTLVVLLSCASMFGQISEGFESTSTPPAGWTYDSVTHGPNNPRTGTRCATFNANNDAIITPLIAQPDQLSFWYRRSGTSPGTPRFTVQYSNSLTGPWTNITNSSTNPIASFTTTYTEFTADLSSLTNVYIRILHTRTSGGNEVYIDDFSITVNNTTPTITLVPATLSGFTYQVGFGPSVEQSFTVSAINLTNSLVILAPSNYEISFSPTSGYVNDLTFYPNASGTINSLTLYIRLTAGLNAATYNGTLNASSTGATTRNINLTGNVTGSQNSDIIAVAGSEAAVVPSTVNHTTLTSTTGVQVWQFKIRDGGETLNDADNLPTILNNLVFTQSATNGVANWDEAIQAIALFDGTTLVGNGVITNNTVTFSGLNIVVADNTEKTISVRMSLRCPMPMTNNRDGEDFGFSIRQAESPNVIFSSAGSGKISGGLVQRSENSTIVIQVTPTRLQFYAQPISTGVSGPMTAVRVVAVDDCGNIDMQFNQPVTITSSGTTSNTSYTSTPALNAGIGNIADFNSIIHTVTGTNLTLTASAPGFASITSNPFNISDITFLQPGDIAILAFNTENSDSEDEISFVSLVDITPGTRIDITDNAYRKCGHPDGWGTSEGWIRLERTNSTLTAGTIITIRVTASGGNPRIYSPDSSNWICSKPQPTAQGDFNLNKNGEQIFFLSGGILTGPNATSATSDAGRHTGTFLYGFNTRGDVWTPICDNGPAGGTSNSAKPDGFDCFLSWPTTQSDYNKYTGPLTPATKHEWVGRINDSSNWTGYASNSAYNGGPNYYGQNLTILPGGNTDGVWIGSKSENWFECGNWQTLRVPDSTVNVILNSNSVRDLTIDATAPFSDIYDDTANCRDITISNRAVKLEGNTNNILVVHGNLTIDGTGSIDMNDGNNSTQDGIIRLHGNWTNNLTSTAFNEGNGTVELIGSTPQIINSNNRTKVEEFHHLILNNNFTTGISNNIIANGNLTVGNDKTLTISSDDFVRINNRLIHNGNTVIENNGQLIQVNELDTNGGTYSSTNFLVRRNYTAKDIDYVYWSSPVNGVNSNSIPSGLRYEWNPVYNNVNGSQGNWRPISTPTLPKGKGVIARTFNGSSTNITNTFTFGGRPHNGAFTYDIFRGNYNGVDYTTTPTNSAGVLTTKDDDNWNLLGNPYPSAINAGKFIALNSTKIVGAVWIWRHGLGLSDSYNPYFYNFALSYLPDYIECNGLACSDANYDGNIASGQGFMVSMLHTAGTFVSSGPTSAKDVYRDLVTFNNGLRYSNTLTPYDNSQFYRAGQGNDEIIDENEEKSRMWLDIISHTTSQTHRAVIGYSTHSTMEKDYFYDCLFVPRSDVSLYSMIGNESFSIQGRALPFDYNDKVDVGISTTSTGNHTIALHSTDGILGTENVEIYLEDRYQNVIHNLKESAYTFTSGKGNYNDRFVIRYSRNTLSNPEFSAENQVIVSTKGNLITINSKVENLTEILVYDILGRELFQNKNINDNDYSFTTNANNQTLIVKIKLANGVWTTKKVLVQ